MRKVDTAGARLKSWMAKNKVTSLSAALSLEVWPSQVSRILNDRSAPNLRTAFLIEDMTSGEVKARDFIQ